jgi:hypothetical protein
MHFLTIAPIRYFSLFIDFFIIAMYLHFLCTFWHPEKWWWCKDFDNRFKWVNRTAVLSTILTATISIVLVIDTLWLSKEKFEHHFQLYSFLMRFSRIVATIVWWSISIERLTPLNDDVDHTDYN